MIVASGVVRSYGPRKVLNGADLAVEAGECLVLTGDNGSGKTTLLHVMVGLRHLDEGEVRWRGRPLTGAGRGVWREARERWGFLPQHVDLPPMATVRQLLRFHARLRERDVADAERWLARVGLGEVQARRVGELSGGMRQRLGIALTFFFDPELIVMDEPASSLDPGWRDALAEWATERTRQGGAVLVTSQLDASWGETTVRRHCSAGRIVDPGTPGRSDSRIGEEFPA